MKIRQGFVSNSSSSSFIIATKEGVNDEKLKKIIVDDVLQVEETSPLLYIAEEIARLMVDSERLTFAELSDGVDWYGLLGEALKYNHEIQMALDKGLTVFRHGYASSDGGITEKLLCAMAISYDYDGIIIKKDGGY